jgi:hypothetical protein
MYYTISHKLQPNKPDCSSTQITPTVFVSPDPSTRTYPMFDIRIKIKIKISRFRIASIDSMDGLSRSKPHTTTYSRLALHARSALVAARPAGHVNLYERLARNE